MQAIRIVLWIFITGIFGSAGQAADEPVAITVYRSPTCGCCGKWIDHLKENNFDVKDIVSDEMDAIKARHGIPKEMASCHTAIVDGYVVEGHVPASDITNMLKTRPKVAGLAVPGMVTGSPGMEMGGRVDPYDVMSFDKENHFQIFHRYSGK
jgi:hypothetical protein